MADTTALKNRIRAAIKANDNQEITGPVLQQSLLDIVDELDLNPELENEVQQRQSGDSALQQAIDGVNTIKFTNSVFGNQVIKELYIEDRKGHDKIVLVDVKRAYLSTSTNTYSWQLSLNYEDFNGGTGRFGSFITEGKAQDSYDESSYVEFKILNEGSKIYALVDWSAIAIGSQDFSKKEVNNYAFDLNYSPSISLTLEKNKVAKLDDKISGIDGVNTIKFTNSVFGNQVIKELYIEDRKGHDKIVLVDVKRAYLSTSTNTYSWQLSLNYEDFNGGTGRFGSFITEGKAQDSYDESSYVEFKILNEGSKIYALVDWSAIAIGSQDFSKKEVNNYAFDLNYSPSISLTLEKNKVEGVPVDLYMIKDRFLSFSVDKEEEITSLIVNKNSTQETKNLFWNLKKNAYDYKTIFGQHNTNITGVSEEGDSWDLRSSDNFSTLVGDKYIVNNVDSIEWKSDIHRVSGYKPFLLSDDLGYSVGEYYSNVKKKNAADIIGACRKFYKETRGIITFSFHFQNPWYSYEEGATGDPYRYKSENHPYVLRELTDGTTILHDDVTVTEWFNGLLDEWAEIINDITDEEGNLITVIIRPFQECSSDAFWWGHSYGTPEEYKNAFIHFVNKITSKCNNVLIAYSPDRNWTSMSETDRYMDRYPGDGYVDIMGYDDYSIGTDDISNCINRAKLVTLEAEKRKKIPALTETGNNRLNVSKWFNDYLYKVLNDYEVRFAYSSVWSNGSASMYYTPFQSSGESTEDFKKFMSRKDIVKSESNIDYYSNIVE